jgi:hypothetical protein
LLVGFDCAAELFVYKLGNALKVEFYDRYLWPPRAAAKPFVGDWIARVYIRRRRHSALGIISPVECEHQLTQTAQAA